MGIIQRDKMKLLKILLGAALVAGQQRGNAWEEPSGGRQRNAFLSNENENQDGGNQGGWNQAGQGERNQFQNTEQPRYQGGRNQGGQNQFQNTEQPRGQPNRGQPNEFEGGARQGQCSPQDFQRTLQTACQNYQNGASASQAVQPAAYFHFSTGTAGQESRNNPVQFENADFMAGFTQRGGVFTVPYDGVYEFGVSLRLDRRRDAPLYMYIRVNNEDKLKCVAISDMSNCHGMIKAQQGDRVFVRTERNGHYGNNRDSHLYSFFEGRLVHQDAPTGSPRGATNPEVPRQGGRGQNRREPDRYSVEQPRSQNNRR